MSFSGKSSCRLTSSRYQNTITRSYNDDSTVATEGLITNGQNYQISHFFDSAKRNYQTTYPNGKILSQAFTARNQLSSVSYDAQFIANFQYDSGMRETSRGLGNGLTQTTIYRPDNLILQKAVAGITNYSYTYDNNKRKLTETDGTMSSLSQTFAYDFEDRLTSWTSNGAVLNTTQSWNLSLEGAWQTNTVNGVAESRTFNQAYETLTSNANQMLHDRKGNLTKNKDGSIYSFDFDNQMAFSTSGTPSVNASYAYDAIGRRVSKTSNNTTVIFVNSKNHVLTEYLSLNNGPFTENQSNIYATYIDEPIALINVNGKYFYHSNSQFSIGAITDSTGNLAERFGYNAYGKPITILESILVNNKCFFTGCQLDSETGLFYFRARYYDASLGQFISRDPIGYVDGLNLYCGYFAINSLDPEGTWMSSWDDWSGLASDLIGLATTITTAVATIVQSRLCTSDMPGGVVACLACCGVTGVVGEAGVIAGAAAATTAIAANPVTLPAISVPVAAIVGGAILVGGTVGMTNATMSCITRCNGGLPPAVIPPTKKKTPPLTPPIEPPTKKKAPPFVPPTGGKKKTPCPPNY